MHAVAARITFFEDFFEKIIYSSDNMTNEKHRQEEAKPGKNSDGGSGNTKLVLEPPRKVSLEQGNPYS